LAGDLAGAVHLYQASLAELPTAEAHTFLGWVYSFERRYDEAIAQCKRAIAVDPTFGNPYNDIGCYLIELGREDDAIPWLKRAIDAPRYEARQFPHVNLGAIYEKKGQVLDAGGGVWEGGRQTARLRSSGGGLATLAGKG